MYLTKKQKEILSFLQDYISTNDYAPTFEEICKKFGYSSKGTVYKHLKNLAEKGFINKTWNRSRAIELLSDFTQSVITELPLLGIVQAGQPIQAYSQHETINVPMDMVSKGRHYVLRVRGDSMIEEHIQDGDFVIVKEQAIAENGDVVIALVHGSEVTIKKFFRENDHIRLQPANPDMNPIIVSANDVIIQGIVVGIMRKFI